MTAERLMLVGGIVAFILTVLWVRGRRLREKYAVAWLTTACVLLLLGLFPQTLMRLADASRLSYPAAVLFVALAAVYLFSMSVSLSLTKQRRLCVRLTQELGLMRMEMEDLQQQVTRLGDHTAPHGDLPRRPK